MNEMFEMSTSMFTDQIALGKPVVCGLWELGLLPG